MFKKTDRFPDCPSCDVCRAPSILMSTLAPTEWGDDDTPSRSPSPDTEAAQGLGLARVEGLFDIATLCGVDPGELVTYVQTGVVTRSQAQVYHLAHLYATMIDRWADLAELDHITSQKRANRKRRYGVVT